MGSRDVGYQALCGLSVGIIWITLQGVSSKKRHKQHSTANHHRVPPTRRRIPATPLAMDALGSSEDISRPSEPGREAVIAPGTFKSNFGEGLDAAVRAPADVVESRFPVRASTRILTLILIIQTCRVRRRLWRQSSWSI